MKVAVVVRQRVGAVGVGGVDYLTFVQGDFLQSVQGLTELGGGQTGQIVLADIQFS